MNTARLRTLAAGARRTWRELDYAQRRLFEIQTGIPVTGPPRRTERHLESRVFRRDY